MVRHSYLRNVDKKFVIKFENTSLVSEVAKLKKENSPLKLFVLLTAKAEILVIYYYMVHYDTIENNTGKIILNVYCTVLYCTEKSLYRIRCRIHNCLFSL